MDQHRSHLVLEPAPARLALPPGAKVTYDAGSRRLVAITLGAAFSWPAWGQSPPGGGPAPPDIVVPLAGMGGAHVTSSSLSPDGRTLGLLRGPSEVELLATAGPARGCTLRPPGASPLLGFFFTGGATAGAAASVALVTPDGLHMCHVLPSGTGAEVTESKRHTVHFYRHEPEAHTVLLGKRLPGGGCRLQLYHYPAAGGPVLLPHVIIPAPGPPPVGLWGALWGAAPPVTPPAPPLGSSSFRVIQAYGRLFVVHLDPGTPPVSHPRAVLYRMYRETAVTELELALPSAAASLAVVDSVLAFVDAASAVILLYDVRLGPAMLAAPLPLAADALMAEDEPSREAEPSPSMAARAARELGFHAKRSSWSFCAPDILWDGRGGRCYRLHLDLGAIAATWHADRRTLAAFLLRRAPGGPGGGPRALCLSTLGALLAAMEPLPAVGGLLTALLAPQTTAAAPPPGAPATQPGHSPARGPSLSPVVTPPAESMAGGGSPTAESITATAAAVYAAAFAPLMDGLTARGGPGHLLSHRVGRQYLAHAILELGRAASTAPGVGQGPHLPPAASASLVRLLAADADDDARLGALCSHGALVPDCPEVASALAEAAEVALAAERRVLMAGTEDGPLGPGEGGSYSSRAQLAAEARARGGRHGDLVSQLLREGQVLPAVRAARRGRVALSPPAVLRAAACLGATAAIAAVNRVMAQTG